MLLWGLNNNKQVQHSLLRQPYASETAYQGRNERKLLKRNKQGNDTATTRWQSGEMTAMNASNTGRLGG